MATTTLCGTLDKWKNKRERALLSFRCFGCPKMTEIPPCCLEWTQRCLGLTIKATTKRGRGLFATRDLKAGDVIVHYIGLVQSEAPMHLAYALRVTKKRYIDAKLLRGLGSFVNHSGKCNVRAHLRTFHKHHFPTRNGQEPERSYAIQGSASFPSVLLENPFVEYQHYWYIAHTQIQKNTELKVNYGPVAGAINGLEHETKAPFS